MASNIAKNKCPFAHMFILEIQFLITMFFTNKGCSQNILIIKFARWNIQSIGKGQTSTSSTHRWIDVFFWTSTGYHVFFSHAWNLGISWNHICKVKGLYTQVLWLYMIQVPGTSSGSVLTMAFFVPFISIQPIQRTDQRRLRSYLWLVITTATTGLWSLARGKFSHFTLKNGAWTITKGNMFI